MNYYNESDAQKAATLRNLTTVAGRRPDGSKATVTLQQVAMFCGWPTATANDSIRSPAHDFEPTPNVTLNHAATLAGWATPAAQEPGGTAEQMVERKRRGNREKDWGLGVSVTGLSLQAPMAAWATPSKRDYRTPNLESFAERGGGQKGEQLSNQVIHAGPALIGSSAETARGARLNPSHARWLMRLPPAWDDAAVAVSTRSRKK